jgi:hypothetical protein
VIDRFRRWCDVVRLQWKVTIMRGYLQSILTISEDPQARKLAAAALIESAHGEDLQ